MVGGRLFGAGGAIVLALLALVACSSGDTAAVGPASGPEAGSPMPPVPPSGTPPTAPVSVDAGGDASGGDTDSDGDGLSDALERSLATDYLPFVSVHPSDGCKTHGLLVRIAPHPKEPKRVMMWIDVLYDQDCGANGHPGDDEMFGAVIDPSKPAPTGILALRAISHQGTPCEHTSTCGSCTGMTACATAERAGKTYPVVFPSKDKHGNYVDKGACDTSFICDFGGCGLASAPDTAPIVNAGEPAHPLVHDLTTEGFVTSANGWTQAALMHFDPWKAGTFGGAGDVSKDLVDVSFVIDTKACP
jgi:hypothetical protein